jgi:hypothetical protein
MANIHHAADPEILEFLGMKVLQDGEVKETEKGKNLPAVPETFSVSSRVFSDAIRIACKVVQSGNREVAKARMRQRIVMMEDGVTPLVANILFEGQIVRDGSGHPIDIRISAKLSLPNDEVDAIPLISSGISYIVYDKVDDRFRSNGNFKCIALYPKRKGGKFALIPLGLVDPKSLALYNEVAKASGKWGEIEPIENNLDVKNTRTMLFKPDRRQKVQLPKGRSEIRLGYHFGKKVILAENSQKPPHDVDPENDEKCFIKKHLFRVNEYEGVIKLFWLCREGGVVPDTRSTLMEMSNNGIDGFAALGLTPLTFDPARYDRTARALTRRGYDSSNPLYSYALETGLVLEDDNREQCQGRLVELAKESVGLVRKEMNAQYGMIMRNLRALGSTPSMEALLQGNRLSQVLYTLNPDDATAKWIDSKIAGKFQVSSPFHREVRKDILKAQAQAEGYRDPPIKPVKEKVVKPSPETEVAAPAEPAQQEVVAEGGEEKEAATPVVKKPVKKKPVRKAKGTNGAGKPKAPRKPRASSKKKPATKKDETAASPAA